MSESERFGIVKKIVAIIILEMFFLLFIMIEQFIPGELSRTNISSSYNEYVNEINYKDTYLWPGGPNYLSMYDDFSTSYLLNIIYCEKNEDAGIYNRFIDSISNKMYLTKHDGPALVIALGDVISGGKETNYSYARYFLGFNLVYKLLFQIFTLNEIRNLFFLIFIVIFGMCFYAIYKEISVQLATAYMITTVFMGHQFNIGDLTAIPDILTLHISILIIVTHYLAFSDKKTGNRTILCFIVGALNFFLGFAYAQPMVIGSIVVLFLILDNKHAVERRIKYKNMLQSMGAWLLGYLITCGFKQLLSYVFLNNLNGFRRAGSWMYDSVFNKLLAFIPPLKRIVSCYTSMKLFLLFGAIIVLLYIFVMRIRISMSFAKEQLTYVFIAFIPAYLWMFALSNAVYHWFYLQNYYPMIWMITYSLVLVVTKGNGQHGREDTR